MFAVYHLSGVFYWFEWVIYFSKSWTPVKFEWTFRYVIIKNTLVIGGWGISCETDLIWMLLDYTYDQWTLFYVMTWCCQTTSHNLIHWWPRYLSPYGVTKPEWVNWCYCISFHHSIIVFCNISWIWTEYENKFKYIQCWCTHNYFYIIYIHLHNMIW